MKLSEVSFQRIMNRLGQGVSFVLALSLVTFILVHLAPGDPAEILLGSFEGPPTQEALSAFRKQAGLEDSLPLQYLRWVGRVVRLDLGTSFRTGAPVTKEILTRLPATLELALAAFGFMILFSSIAGITGALCQDRFPDHLVRVWTILNASLPAFWLGPLLIYFFSLKCPLFPPLGRGTLRHLFLPALTLGLGLSAVYGRVFRASLIHVLSQDYIRLAYAKGLSTGEVLLRHAIRNALLPMMTLWGVSFGHLLGGAAIVESVFAWPGIGKLAVEAIFNRDYPVVLGYVVFSGLIFVSVNKGVDCLHRRIDPRIRLSGR